MKQLPFLFFLIYACNIAHAQTWQWAVGGGSSNNSAIADQFERIEDIALDVHGNVYTLSNVGTNDINVGGVLVPGWTYGNIMINSFTCDGAFRWAKIIGPIGPRSGIALRTDSLDGVYFIIDTNVGDSLHVDDDTTLWEPSQKSAWLFSYDTSGNLKWFAGPETGQGEAEQTGLEVDGDGNVYWLCHLHPGLYGGMGGYNVTSEGEYILRYNKDGIFQGATKLDMFVTNTPQRLKLTLDPNSGNFILSETMPAKVYLGSDSTTNSMFLAAFDKNGSFLWKKENKFQQTWAAGLRGRPAIDGEGNIYLAGYANAGDEFAGHTVINGGGNNNTAFIVKLDKNGNKLWAKDAFAKAKAQGQAIALRNSGEVDLLSYASYLQWPPSQDTSSTFNAGTVVTRFNTQTGKFLGFDTTSTSLPFPGGGAMVISEPTAAIANGRNGIFVGGSFMHSLIAGNNPAVNKTGGYDDFFIAQYGNDSCDCTAIPEPKFTSINTSGNTFNFTYTGSTPYTSILWDFGDGNTSTQTNPAHTFSKDGKYPVTVTVTNDCGDNTYGSNQVALKVGTTAKADIRIYPNPAKNLVQIEGAVPVSVQLHNIHGQMLKSFAGDLTRLDVATLSMGVYLLRVEGSDGVHVHKLIKE
jgi:hypothetical protein